MAVHCRPYSFTFADSIAQAVAPEPAIPGFYAPERAETLLVLTLHPEFDAETWREWFALWTAEDLLFLTTVRILALHDLGGERPADVRQLGETSPEILLDLDVGGVRTPVRRQGFEVDGQFYDRFVASIPVPENTHRADKATDDRSEVAIAIPSNADARGRLYLGLPTQATTGAAFSVDGQFDPATTREDLTKGKWNKWLLTAAGELLASSATHIAQEGGVYVWNSVPVQARPESANPWVVEQLDAAWKAAIQRFADSAHLPISGKLVPLAQILMETEEAEDLFQAGDHERLAEGTALPPQLRDSAGSWRKVIEGIGRSRILGLQDLLEGCDGQAFDNKLPDWFLLLADRLIQNEASDLLFEHRWLPLASGARTAPSEPDVAEGLISLRQPDVQVPGEAELALVADRALAADEAIAIGVREWLSANANFVEAPEAADLLAVFARHHANQPLDVTEDQIVALRDLFERVDTGRATALGNAVGEAVRIEAFAYRRGRGVERETGIRAHPWSVYLPASIEDEPSGWSRAAATTPDLLWAAPRYEKMFAVSRSRRQGSRREQVRGAKRFLMLLGAEIAPRLESQDTPVRHPVPELQKLDCRRLGQGAGILVDDHVSPDLERVLADLAVASPKAKPGRNKSGRRKRVRLSQGYRGFALFRCLAANWTRLYGANWEASLYRDRKNPVFLTRLPSTWMARLAGARWLEDEDGTPRSPIGMIVPTPMTHAIYEPNAPFAAFLEAGDAREPLARRLGMIVDPPASDILQEIEKIKLAGGEPNEARLLRLYRALALHCRSATSAFSRIGDIDVGRLRGKFGIAANRAGLIHPVAAPGAKSWIAPAAAFAGMDIFHGRRPFVLPDRDLAPLWTKLNIRAPDGDDCVKELAEISKQPTNEVPPALLIDIYRHLDGLVRTGTSAKPALRSIPLACGGQWVTTRPVYFADQRELEGQLPGIPLWDAPCAVEPLGALRQSAGIEALPIADAPTILGDFDFTTDSLREGFAAAVEILRDDLARDDERSYYAGEWDALSSANLHVTGPQSLWLEVSTTPRQQVNVRAHAQTNPASLYIEEESVLADIHGGGRAVARFFHPDRRRPVSLAWVSAWTQAQSGVRRDGLRLAKERDSNSDPLADFQTDLVKRRKRKAGAGTTTAADPAERDPPPPPPPPLRRLKDFPDEILFDARLEDADPNAPPPGGRPRRRGKLPENEPDSKSRTSAPASARTDYTPQERQAEAWRYLELAMSSEGSPLKDHQAIKGLGADGSINWKTFVEMKSHGRGFPNCESLTAAEVQRAFKEGPRFILAVVSGLEEGFKTEIRLFADPLRTLPWTPNGNIVVSALNQGRKLVVDVDGRLADESDP